MEPTEAFAEAVQSRVVCPQLGDTVALHRRHDRRVASTDTDVTVSVEEFRRVPNVVGRPVSGETNEAYNDRGVTCRMGIVRTLQFVGTLVVAGPVALAGVFHAADGQYPEAAVFLGVALGIVALSEYLYLDLTDRTIGRLRRLKNVRAGGDE